MATRVAIGRISGALGDVQLTIDGQRSRMLYFVASAMGKECFVCAGRNGRRQQLLEWARQ